MDWAPQKSEFVSTHMPNLVPPTFESDVVHHTSPSAAVSVAGKRLFPSRDQNCPPARITMSSCDEIFASIRANRPKMERPRPTVPLFDADPPASGWSRIAM